MKENKIIFKYIYLNVENKKKSLKNERKIKNIF